MRAVMYGAGNIGRGFIGALFAEAGFAVTFVDVSQELVDKLNAAGEYTVRVISNEGFEDTLITGVNALHSSECDRITEAIANADIMATAVGAGALRHIAPNIAFGLRKRRSITDTPLDILICENLSEANTVLRKLLKEQTPPEEHSALDEHIGLVETSIGRMVPVQTPEMQHGDPLRVCVERYGFLPVDKDAFKCEIPKIGNLVPYSPFGFYKSRKLYLHNMSHAITAYLGLYAGYNFIYEAIDDPYIRLIVKEAMGESMEALCEEYSAPMRDLRLHSDDLIIRFTNRALGDTCARVGNDTVRKLQNSDRLAGAAQLCERHDILPVGIAIGIAGAIHQYLIDTQQPQSDKNAATALAEISGLDEHHTSAQMTLKFYTLYRRGATPKQLYTESEQIKELANPEIK